MNDGTCVQSRYGMHIWVSSSDNSTDVYTGWYNLLMTLVASGAPHVGLDTSLHLTHIADEFVVAAVKLGPSLLQKWSQCWWV